MNIFDPHISGSLSVSGSGEISGDLTVLGTLIGSISGTSENAISASHAANYTLTSSFGAFTSSYTTGSFTGSFSGNGSGLNNIPASGVTGLNLTRIADGGATASISSTNGLRINANTEITGALKLNKLNLGGNDIVEITLTDAGGKYFINGVRNPRLSFIRGFKYRFYYDNNNVHPLLFSITNDGEHNGGVVYSTGVTSGSNPFYVQIEVTEATPATLYYFCDFHIGMGNSISVYSDFLNAQSSVNLTNVDTGMYATTGSNNFTNIQRTSGSLVVTGSVDVTGSINLFGTANISGSILLNGQAIGTGKLDETIFNNYTSSNDGRLFAIENSTSSYNTFTSSIDTRIKNEMNEENVISGSIQVALTGTTGYSTFSSSISTSIGTLDYNFGVTASGLSSSVSTLSSSFEITASNLSSSIGSLSSSVATTTSNLSSSVGVLSSSFNSVNNTQDNKLSSIESTTSSLNTYTSSNTTNINAIHTATSSLNSFSSSILNAVEVTGSNLTVKGDLLVKGTTTQIDSTTLNIGDNIIQLNGTAASNAGLVVQDASGVSIISGSLIWDTATDNWKAGKLGSEERIILVNEYNTFSTSIDSRATSIQTATASLNSYTSSNNSRLTSIESTTGSLNTFTSSASGRLDSLETSTGSLNTHTSSTNARLGAIESTTASLNSYTSSNNTRLSVIETATSSLNTFTSSANGRISSLESASSSIRTDFNSFTSSNISTETTQNSRLTTIESTTGSLNSYTSSTNTRLEVIESTTSSLNSSTSSLNSYTSSTNTRLGVIESTTSSLNSYTSSTNTRLGSIESTTGSLNSYTGSNNTNITAIHTATSSLNSFTSSINTTIKNRLDSENVISGSAQVMLTGTTGYSTFSSSLATTDAGQDSKLTSIEGKTGSYATTGSNIFQGNQTITGSLFVSENLIIAGSSSIQHISSSVVNIADNIITVNAQNPGIRFGGLAVIDSGSSPQVSGSILFDSVKNEWLFVHQNQGTITSSVVLMGPETFNNLGGETYLTQNRIPKGTGIEHLNDSNITDTGTKVSINSNTEVTGTLRVTGNITNPNITAIETSTSSLNTFTSSLLSAVELTGSNLTVRGNLLVKGTTTNVNTSTLDVDNNLINLNGSGASFAGIRIKDTTAPSQVSGSLLWDASNDYWIAGQLGSEQRLVRETEFNNAVTRIGNVETSTGSLNSYTSSTNTRLGVIESTTSSLNSYTSSTNTKLGNLETSTGSLNTFTSSANGRLNSLESASGSIRTDFNSYTSSNNTTNSTQNTRLDLIETSTGSLNTFTSSASGRLSAIESTTASLNSYTSSNTTNINAIHTATASLNSYTSSNITNINAIHTATSSLNSYTSSNTTAINAINTATSSLNTFTSSFNSAFSLSGADVTVRGNFTVSGTTTTVNSTTVNIADNIIQLNGTGATNAGLVVRDATASTLTSGSLLWDTTNDKWIAGPLGSEDDVVLRTASQTLTNKTINASQLVDGSVSNTKLANSSFNIGTTSISLGRASASQTLTGVSVDGNAGTVTNGVYTTGDQTIAGAKTFSETLKVLKAGRTLTIGQDYANHINWDSNVDLALNISNGGTGGIVFFGGGSSSKFSVTSAGVGTFAGNLSAANLSGTNTGDQTNISGNAGTVTNGVYTTGDQTIGGTKTFSANIINSATADWYMYGFGARGASSGAYGMGLASDIANRTLSFHIPNHAAYSSAGNIPKFGWYSNGSAELMTLQSATGNLVVTGTIAASNFSGTSSGTNTGDQTNISGNAGTVTNGVYTTGNQTIGGTKTFSSTISGSITGNANTATTLATARNIGGVSFNGSANIDLPGVNTTGNQNTTGNAATATEVIRTVSAGTEANLLYSTVADNDFFRIRVGGASNSGFVEIATADDATEPIHVRQYSGTFSTLTRTATLLDASGNTSFPGTVTAPTFSGVASSITNQANSATITASTGINASQIVQRDSNGYIYANHVNFNTSESENPTISSFITSNGDGWSRKSSLAHVRNQLGNYGSWISGNQTITISGDASGSGTTSISLTVNQIDGVGFVNSNINNALNANSVDSNVVGYVTNVDGSSSNLTGNSTDGALYGQAYSSSWQHQIYGDYRTGIMYVRGKNSNTWQSWKRVALSSATTFSNVSSLTFTHNLGTANVTAQVFDTNGDMFFPSNIRINSTQVIVTFASSRSGRLVVTG